MNLKNRLDSTEFEAIYSYQILPFVSRTTDLSHSFVACEWEAVGIEEVETCVLDGVKARTALSGAWHLVTNLPSGS
jgi:hypothetical protein